ncbi:MAG: peptidoglycan-associated lipoprotein Pal [Thiotrichales bacterium]
MMRSILLVVVAALALGGCAGNKKATKPEIDRGAEQVVAPPQTQGAGTGNGTVVEMQLDPFEDPSNPLSQLVIYFDYDSAEVKDLNIANAHAQYLADHPSAKVRLEGHADERGTREYNVALSERRALAVKELMMFRGVRPNQITVIAYGEERPVAFGHDERSWALNRRVEIVYEAK